MNAYKKRKRNTYLSGHNRNINRIRRRSCNADLPETILLRSNNSYLPYAQSSIEFIALAEQREKRWKFDTKSVGCRQTHKVQLLSMYRHDTLVLSNIKQKVPKVLKVDIPNKVVQYFGKVFKTINKQQYIQTIVVDNAEYTERSIFR